MPGHAYKPMKLSAGAIAAHEEAVLWCVRPLDLILISIRLFSQFIRTCVVDYAI